MGGDGGGGVRALGKYWAKRSLGGNACVFSSAFFSVEREGDEDGSEMPPWDKEKEEEEEEGKDRKEKGRLASETGHNDNDRI